MGTHTLPYLITPQLEGEKTRRKSEEGRALTFILSIEASILNCWTVLRAWAMLLVVLAVLPDIFSEAVKFCFERQRVSFPEGGTACQTAFTHAGEGTVTPGGFGREESCPSAGDEVAGLRFGSAAAQQQLYDASEEKEKNKKAKFRDALPAAVCSHVAIYRGAGGKKKTKNKRAAPGLSFSG